MHWKGRDGHTIAEEILIVRGMSVSLRTLTATYHISSGKVRPVPNPSLFESSMCPLSGASVSVDQVDQPSSQHRP